MTQWVELHVPGVPASRFELNASPTFVGTGSDATLRVSTNTGLASRHFRLLAETDGVEISVDASVRQGFFHEGSEYRSITVPWGSEIFVGNVRVVFRVEVDPISSAGRLALVVAMLIVGIAFVGMYKLKTTLEASQPPNDIATLNRGGSVVCPASEPKAAERRAAEIERAASAKRQRFSFDPRDGVDALSLLRQSEACYRAAGEFGIASRVHADADNWLQILNTEYSTARLRLKFNLEHDRISEAIETIGELQAFVATDGQGPYGQWLIRTRESLLRRRDTSQK